MFYLLSFTVQKNRRPNSGAGEFALTISTAYPTPQLNSLTAVRIRVKATSLNFANYLQILGKYQEKSPLPFIPGSDYSGTVDFVGPSVTELKFGDPVCSFTGLGSFVQFIVSDDTELFIVSKGCDLVAAGALRVAYGTSHMALVHRAQLHSGQVLLVLGAAGGVGVYAVQIGKVCGATVIAAARIGLFMGSTGKASYKMHRQHVLEDSSTKELLSLLAMGTNHNQDFSYFEAEGGEKLFRLKISSWLNHQCVVRDGHRKYHKMFHRSKKKSD